MTKEREALKLALEAMETLIVDVKTTPTAYEAQRQAIAAIKEALAQPEQEPVAKKHEPTIDLDKYAGTYGGYTTSPQRTWVGLTDEERTEIRNKVQVYTSMDNIQYGLAIQRATETVLKEKNT